MQDRPDHRTRAETLEPKWLRGLGFRVCGARQQKGLRRGLCQGALQRSAVFEASMLLGCFKGARALETNPSRLFGPPL